MSGAVLAYVASGPQAPGQDDRVGGALAAASVHEAAPDPALDPGGETALSEEYCVRCHSDRRLQGNLSLEEFDASAPAMAPELAEKLVVKLRAEMMPPPGARRP